jgi:hypothetical protein
MTGIQFADKPPTVSDAVRPNAGRIVMQKGKYSSVSKFATLSLMVIFISSLLHHEWWQAAGCVVAFELLANLPYIFSGKMGSGEV